MPAPHPALLHPGAWPGAHAGLGTGSRAWLVRHAEVHADWQRRAYGDTDVPLSEGGLRESDELGRRYAELAPRVILSSPLERAARLARAIASGADRPLALADGLREIRRGAWQGLEHERLMAERPREVAAYYADPWSFAEHGGETDADVLARAWPLLERALADARGGTAVLVAHYNVIRVLLARALGIPPPRSFALRIDPGRGALLHDRSHGRAEGGPGGFALRCANARDPLAARSAAPGEAQGAAD